MGLRNSEIIICKNIKLDKDYKNVLNYTENQMLALCREKAVATATDYSFIRKEKGYIKTSFSYNDALKCNYLAFQNKDYSNKWFFAFIDDVEYVSDGTCYIRYTIDEFSTWFDYWNPEACLVLREHVNSDNIGEHTYPENLEHGPYIANWYGEYGRFNVESCYVVIATTWLPHNTPGITPVQYYGGVFSGVYFIAFDTYTYANNFILALDGFGRGDSIVSVFMAPASICSPLTSFSATLHSKINNDDGTTSAHDFHIEANFIGNSFGAILLESDLEIPLNTSLNGYTPKNKKLYTWPFNYLLVTNQVGVNAEFHYEDFINNLPTFNILGVLSVGCSVKMYPENYKKLPDSDLESTHPGFNDGIVGAKFPVCSFRNDSFTNWMAQQSVNRFMNMVGTGANIITTLAAGEGGSDSFYGGLFRQQANYLSELYQHALVAPQASGNTNGAEVTFARNEQNFGVYKMSIKAEYARKIDEYFNKFGYQVNEVKVPNQVGRTYWNFVQIGPYEDIGYSTNTVMSVPSGSMDIINKIYRNGTTIWHSHSNIGNYSLDNSL